MVCLKPIQQRLKFFTENIYETLSSKYNNRTIKLVLILMTAITSGCNSSSSSSSKAGITNSHTSAITGNIGASPITAAAMDNFFCTEITGIIYGSNAAYIGSGAVACFKGEPVNST